MTKTGERLLESPIDCIYDDLNIPAFVVEQNGKSRLVCSNGEFLTAFVEGEFHSKGVSSVRKKLPESAKMIVYNEIAKIAFWTDWEKFEPMDIKLAIEE